MAFQLFCGLFGRGLPPCSRTHGPTVENATADDQRRETRCTEIGRIRLVTASQGNAVGCRRPKFSHWRPTWGPSLSHPTVIRTLHKTVRVRKMKPGKADKTDCFENEVESLCWMKFQVPQRTGMTTQNLHLRSQPHQSRMLTPMLAALVLPLPINPTPMFAA